MQVQQLPVKSSGMNVCSTLPCDGCTHPVTSIPTPNSTMRLSFGTVCGYAPFDGAEYDYYTTTKGILEKSEPMQAMWILKCSPSCYSFFPLVISVDMPMKREK